MKHYHYDIDEEYQSLAINLATANIMSFFQNSAYYTRIGFAAVTDNNDVCYYLEAVEKVYERIDELLLEGKIRRALHYCITLRYLVKKLKISLDNL